MLTLKAKIREKIGKAVKNLRKKGILPAVLYGPKIKNLNIELDLKEFEDIFKQAGESSLISLEVGPLTEGSAKAHPKSSGQVDKFLVLIHGIKKDPLMGKIIHVDFYQPILTEEIEAAVPIIFEGEALAVKELNGTLVKEIQEIDVKALPRNLPHDIKVNIESLKTFEDEILVKDLKFPENVKVQKEPDEIVAIVTPPEKVEEELEKPIEEKVEEVEEAEEKEEKEKESVSTEATSDKKEKKEKR